MQNKTANAIQSELEFMRRMYAERRSLNHPRHEALVGWSLLTVALAVPAIAALIVILL
jgi:hypothetical protein